jgi:hypothetical protein
LLKCRIIDDKCRILQHANAAADEVRRPEFFRKGGVARAVALPEELWIDQPRWQRLKPMEKLADMLVNLERILNNLPDQGEAGRGGGGQRQYQSITATWARLSHPQLPAADSPTTGRHENRIRHFSESQVKHTLFQFVG